jgi:hypothetical protein
MMNTELVKVNSDMPELVVSLGTLQATSPAALVYGAAEMAKELATIIAKQKLFSVIQGKRFVNVEGWTTLATMLGCVAREIETTEHDGVYVAIVELVRMNDGACIGRASAECGEESPWSKRAKYARRSMAQTRATSKACRLAFSWIMQLAGYEVTPAEEMQPLVDAVPLRISARQLKLLEAQIRDYKFTVERVTKWTKTAWQINDLKNLSPEQFEKLLERLEGWAAQEYARQEAISASDNFDAEPLTYATVRG